MEVFKVTTGKYNKLDPHFVDVGEVQNILGKTPLLAFSRCLFPSLTFTKNGQCYGAGMLAFDKKKRSFTPYSAPKSQKNLFCLATQKPVKNC